MKVRKIISIFACVLAVASVLTLSSCKKKNAVVINGIADLDGKKIGVQTGTTGEMWVEQNLPGAKMSSFKSGIDAALDLINGSSTQICCSGPAAPKSRCSGSGLSPMRSRRSFSRAPQPLPEDRISSAGRSASGWVSIKRCSSMDCGQAASRNDSTVCLAVCQSP